MRADVRMLPQLEPRNPASAVLEVQSNDEGAARFILNGRETLSVLTIDEVEDLGRWLLLVAGIECEPDAGE